MSGSAQKEERNPTSDFAARSGEHGAVRAADVVVAHFHAEVPLPHAAQRHLHHAHVRRLQSHPPPLATSTERKMTWKLENQLVFLFITAGGVGGGGGVGKVGGRPNWSVVFCFFFTKNWSLEKKNACCDGLINVERLGESRERTAHSTGLWRNEAAAAAAKATADLSLSLFLSLSLSLSLLSSHIQTHTHTLTHTHSLHSTHDYYCTSQHKQASYPWLQEGWHSMDEMSLNSFFFLFSF